MNFIPLLVAALVPMVVGFIWYNPKTLGNTWMKAAGLSEEQLKGGNMALIFSLSYLLSFLAAVAVHFTVVHQAHVYSVLMNEPGFNDPNSEITAYLNDFMARFGDNFRTFKHGAFHGMLTGFMLVMPVLAINALFERKGFKYIAINSLYWIITLSIMGGIICAWQ